MKKLSTILIALLALFGILSGFSCMENLPYSNPIGYDLNKPIKYFMPNSLKEISGIAFHRGKNDTLYAEQDEDGKIYYFRLGDKQVSYSRFGKAGDYEDIAILAEQVILLRSDGTLFTFPFKAVKTPEISNVQKWSNILPSGEYEGLCADEKTGLLYVLCKNCSDDNNKSTSGYIFKLLPNGSVKQTGKFSINVKEIDALTGKKKISFHPSALAKNQNTNEWYILSSVNKMLVVADAGWKVKAVYPLNPSLFIQPEGIAFDNKNNLYISNEGDKITQGTVLKFNYTK